MGLIKESLAYPFRKFGRLFIWYWNLVPILGWLIFSGYSVDILDEVVAGRDDELPEFGEFGDLLKHGFFYMLIALIVTIAAQILMFIPFVGWIAFVYIMLILPVMLIQYATSKSFKAGLDFVKATKLVFGNFVRYLLLILQLIAVTIIWLLASIPIITIIVTLPALKYSSIYLMAQFYSEVA